MSTPVHPTPVQSQWLQGLITTAARLHAALQHAPDGPHDLRDALRRAAAGERLPPRPVRQPPAPDLLERVLAALPDTWRELPDALIRGVVQAYVRTPSAAFKAVLSLDDAVIPAGRYHVHVSGQPELLLTDVWRLPLGLPQVLLSDGAVRRAVLAAQLDEARAADLASDAGALRRVQRLARQAGPLLAAPCPDPVPAPSGVERVYATLRPVRHPGGTPGWTLTWGLRLPAGWLPAASIDDTAGVDLGVHHLISWAAGAACGQIPALTQPTGAWQYPAPPDPLEAALVRHTQFQRRADALDDALRGLLRYRRVAVEAFHAEDLANTTSLESMTLSGVTEFPHWVTQFAQISGSRVTQASSWHGSGQCGRCGRAGCRTGRQFHCGACGNHADADLNAAAWYRRQALKCA